MKQILWIDRLCDRLCGSTDLGDRLCGSTVFKEQLQKYWFLRMLATGIRQTISIVTCLVKSTMKPASACWRSAVKKCSKYFLYNNPPINSPLISWNLWSMEITPVDYDLLFSHRLSAPKHSIISHWSSPLPDQGHQHEERAASPQNQTFIYI